MTGGRRRRRGRRRLDFERTLEPEDSEDDVVSHDVEVPRDDGPFLGDVDDALVHLTLRHCKQSKLMTLQQSTST